MIELGYAFMLLAMVVAAGTAGTGLIAGRKGSRRFAVFSEYGTYLLFGLLTCSSICMVYLFATDEYSVKYVQHYSDRSMPLFYKLSAFWGGQDGSLLFWVWVLSIWGAIAVFQNREKNRELLPYTISALMSVSLFFLVLMVFAANPFETFLAGAPTDGRGLNPLLQNPYMAIHPPTLYLGYIGWTIPFCFAVGALAHGKLDYAWIAAMRRWCLVAWVFLSVGLALGGLWAYEELGWGGYWAWDPVENAALIPWLTGTAFIHSVQVQERRQIFKMWNMLLIIITFVLTIVGTMMTRSGVVQSVHAFAQSSIGNYFGVFLVISFVIPTWLLIRRARELAPKHPLESILSREFAFLLNNWILLFAAFFVLFATLFPSLVKFFAGREVNVGATWYNIWMIPVGLILLFLTGVGPLLSWRKSTGATIRKQFLLPAVLAIVAGGALFAAGISNWRPLATLILCVFVSATILQEFIRGTRYRMRNAGENPLDAFLTLMGRAGRRYGGYVVHFGIVVMFLGFSGEAFKKELDATVEEGKSVELGDYSVRLDRLAFADDGQKQMVTAHVSVADRHSGEHLTTLAPAKWAYRKPEEQVTTEVDKRMSFAEDLYLVLGGYDAERKTAALQIKVNPLVNFVWLGCGILCLGFGIAVWPDKRRARVARRLPRYVLPMGAPVSAFVLAVGLGLLAFQ